MDQSLLVAGFMLLMLTLLSQCCRVHAKRDYLLEIENIETSTPNGGAYYIKFNAIRMVRYNMSSMALNISFLILHDIPTDVMVTMDSFEQMPSKRYTKMPLRFPSYSLCEFLVREKVVYAKIKKEGHMPQKCPITEGHYWVDNYNFDSDTMPERFPGTRWRLDYTLKLKKEIFVSMQVFAFLNRDIVF